MEVSVSAPLDFSLAPRPDVKLPGDPASDSSSAFRVVTPKGKQGLQNFNLLVGPKASKLVTYYY